MVHARCVHCHPRRLGSRRSQASREKRKRPEGETHNERGEIAGESAWRTRWTSRFLSGGGRRTTSPYDMNRLTSSRSGARAGRAPELLCLAVLAQKLAERAAGAEDVI